MKKPKKTSKNSGNKEAYWRGRNVLVTGAGGFIGSHLAERLVEAGARTRALVEYNSLGTWGWLDHSLHKDDMEVVSGDVRDPESVLRAMKDCDVVFHLAALIAIPYSYEAPRSYIETNVIGTVNVLQAARQLNVARVVHTSTSEVYGTARYVPIDEGHPLQGQSPYSASKIAADKMAEAFHRSFGVPVVTVRPFNTYGPRQSARAVIPSIITQCLAGRDVRIGNLLPTRDLNYVGNVVDAFLAAGSAPKAIGQTINIGSGKEISIHDLAHKIAGLIGCPLKLRTDTRRIRPADSEVERLLAANSLALKFLGWKPRIGLDEGLSLTIEWMRDHLAMYRPGVYVL